MIPTNILLQLKTEESVYINNLGLFTKEFISAKVVKGKVNPPKYKVIFDPTAKGNSFGFTLKLSKKEEIRITEADELIKNWVATVQDALNTKGTFKIPDFGTFSLKDEVISFKCGTLALLNSEFEGMEELDLSTDAPKEEEIIGTKEAVIEAEEQPVVLAQPVTQVETTNPVEPSVAKEEPAKEEPLVQKTKEEKNIPPKSRNTGFIVTIIILIFLIFFLIFAYFKKQVVIDFCCNLLAKKIEQLDPPKPVSQVKSDTATIDSTVAKETIEEKTPEVVATPVPAPATTPAPVAEKKQATTTPALQQNVSVKNPVEVITQLEPNMFYLISGSFPDEKSAQMHIVQSNFAKYHPTIIHVSNSNYRVCIGHFENEADALDYKKLMKIDAWVLQK
jgi:cell division septation protein DedD